MLIETIALVLAITRDPSMTDPTDNQALPPGVTAFVHDHHLTRSRVALSRFER